MIKLIKPIKKRGNYNIFLRIKIDSSAILKDLFIRKSEIPNQQILVLNTDYADSSKFSVNHIKYFKINDQKNILGKGWVNIKLCELKTFKDNIDLNIIIQESSQMGKGYHINKLIAIKKGIKTKEF